MSHKLWDLESQCHSNIEFPPCQWPKCKKKFHIAEAAVLVVEKNYSKTLYKTFQPASHFWEKVSTTGAPENLTIYFRSDDKIYLSRSWKYIDLNLMSFFANDLRFSILCQCFYKQKFTACSNWRQGEVHKRVLYWLFYSKGKYVFCEIRRKSW